MSHIGKKRAVSSVDDAPLNVEIRRERLNIHGGALGVVAALAVIGLAVVAILGVLKLGDRGKPVPSTRPTTMPLVTTSER